MVTGDGFTGHRAGAPYDRIIVTCGVREIPHAWVEQVRPGGVILTPWGTHYSHQDALVRLTVGADGTASGRFTEPAQFMKMRAQRLQWPRHAGYVPDDRHLTAERSTTTLTAEDLGSPADRPPPQPLRCAGRPRAPRADDEPRRRRENVWHHRPVTRHVTAWTWTADHPQPPS